MQQKTFTRIPADCHTCIRNVSHIHPLNAIQSVSQRKKMKKFFIITALSVLTLTASAQITITKQGKAEARIVCSDNEKQTIEAAKTFNHFLKLISGSELSVTQDRKVKRGDIVLSSASSVAGDDGFDILCKDQLLRISGNQNGVVYGVCEIFEKYLGVDYLAAGVCNYDKNPNVSLPYIHDVQTPAFSFRQCFSPGDNDDKFVKWFRLEHHKDIFIDDMWVHTFNKIMPSSVYGKDHPEYYSMIRGKRQPGDHSQWCLTNPEVFKTVCRELDKIFAANNDGDIIAISQNDGNDTYCTCDECKKVYEEEGAVSGAYVRFLNKLAAHYPDKKFITLAYLFTMDPPRHVKPADNVYIMLCDIDTKREVPLTDNASGQHFVRAIQGWSAITDKIFVWDYVMNFDNCVEPFPNFHILQDNIRLFHKHNAKMIFEQSNRTIGTDMVELRTYILAKLMWNPEADVDALTKHFLNEYYHEAAPYLYRYLNIMQGALLSSNKELWIYDSPITHKDGMFNKHLMKTYKRLFDDAEEAVKDKKEVLDRVRLARLPLQYTELEIARTENNNDAAELTEKVRLFRERSVYFNVPTLNERANKPTDYCDLYLKRYIPNNETNYALGAKVTYSIKPAQRYMPIADKALTDGLYGGTTFVESWVGWEGIDGEFTLDLGKEYDITTINADFLHQLGQWILEPASVTYSVSTDNKTFTDFGTHKFKEDRGIEVKFVNGTVTKSQPVKARYIKVFVKGIGNCPSWHYGVGYPAWFFIDEITVK